MPASPRSMLKENPLQVQVGGSHYKATKIQPIEVIWDWDLGFELGSALKYIQRHKKKGGAEDIKKAVHYLEMYLLKQNSESMK